MENANSRDESDGDELPESGEYLPDSTLIPQSEQGAIPESSSIDNTEGDGLPGGSAYGVKQEAKKKSFVQKNLPLVVIGVVGVVLAGGFVAKSARAPAPRPSAPPVTQLTPAAASPTNVIAPISAETPLPATGGAAEPSPATTTSVGTPAEPNTTSSDSAGTGKPPKLEAPAEQVTKPPVAPAVTPTRVPEPEKKEPVTLNYGQRSGQPNAATAGATQSAVLANVPEPKDVSPAKQSAHTESSKACAPAAKVEKKQHARKPTSRKPKAVRSKSSEKQSVNSELEEAVGFNVRAIKGGLAWVIHDGQVSVVRIGDRIDGLGAVTRIDDRKMYLVAGGMRVEQQ